MGQFSAAWRLARRDFFKLRKRRNVPAWVMWLLTADYALRVGLLFVALAAFAQRNGLNSSFWLEQAPAILATALLVGAVIHMVFSAIERWTPQRFIDWSNGRPGMLNSLFFALTSTVCVYAGLALSSQLLGSWPGARRLNLQPEQAWLSMAVGVLVVAVIWGLWAWQEWHDERLEHQAQEAQWRLLQAQIEPHYLFNTLANVRSLIDTDPTTAGEMLDAFSDQLRMSLSQMRADSVPLEQELQLVGQYLKLMQMRMGERLRYRIDAEPDARAIAVPPLLLQPLVENAIRHGLERSVEPGIVVVRAAITNERLQITVQDDGVGLDAPNQRQGAGLALRNLRERLAARWGELASLRIEPHFPRGVIATLELPCPSTSPT